MGERSPAPAEWWAPPAASLDWSERSNLFCCCRSVSRSSADWRLRAFFGGGGFALVGVGVVFVVIGYRFARWGRQARRFRPRVARKTGRL